MKSYDHSSVEKKWQEYWSSHGTFKPELDSSKPKFYALDMFTYPSGDGLHTGHPRSFTAVDIWARQKRMQGFNVMYPIGWDAFGLPAERYAVKKGIHPAETTAVNIERFTAQQKMFGFSRDWEREINTANPEYYKWTQWLFKVFFENGIAYQKDAQVNWCPQDLTVLANEQVVDGKCELCGAEVEQKKMSQWFFRITDFAEELIEGLDRVDWPASSKEMQRNWIGRSDGASIGFKLSGTEKVLDIFTTRPDTIYGATFLVVAPEHDMLMDDGIRLTNHEEVKAYIEAARKKSDLERQVQKDKTGVKLEGITAVHPITNDELPIFVADYVMMGYGTGAIMGVPAHDERDHEFAQKYGVEIKEVVEPLFTVTGDAPDAVRESEPYIHRDAMVVIVKHWAEDKFLMLAWKANSWKGFITGGLEEGEKPEEAALREIQEETGYQNAKFVREIPGVVHGRFYHMVKEQNRWGHFRAVYFELQDGEHIDIADEEKAIHDIEWVDRKEMENYITAGDMKLIWSRFNSEELYTGKGVLVNSGEFSGQTSEEAWDAIIQKAGGERKVQYRLRDWSVSRQRYWGAPVPIYYDQENVAHAVPDEDLPVILPMDVDFTPTGEPPLAKSAEFQAGVEDKYGKGARREVETMDTFVDSSWYFLRYCDPHNAQAFAGQESLKYWMPVDLYIGGPEHINGHLLYARFVTKALHKLGFINFDEPFMILRHQGFILGPDGFKMSKSKGNVINPDDLVKEVGADTVRMYEMFMGPFDQNVAWDTNGVLGVRRFLDRVYAAINKQAGNSEPSSEELNVALHRLTKKITEDIAGFKFNTAVSSFMEFLNQAEKQASGEWCPVFVKLLSPFAPHLAEELWQGILGHTDTVAYEKWPVFDEALLASQKVQIIVQEKGKVRGTVESMPDATEAEVIELVKSDSKLNRFAAEYSRTVFVPGKIINFI